MVEGRENAWGDVGPDHGLYGEPVPPGPRPHPPDQAPRLGIADLLDGAFHAVRPVLPALLVTTAVIVTVLTVVDVLALIPVGRWFAVNLGIEQTMLDWRLAGQAAALAAFAEAATRVLALAGTLLVSGALAPALMSALTPAPHEPMSGGPMTREPMTREPMTRGPMTPAVLWNHLRPRLGTLVGTATSVAAILVAGALIGALPGAALMLAGGDVALVAGALLSVAGGFTGFVVVLLLWGVRLCLAPQAAVLEGRGVGSAMARSAALVRGRYWRVLGALAAATVITWVVQGVVSAPFATLSAVVASSDAADTQAALGLTPLQLAISGLGVVVSTTIALPVLAAVLTVLFDDIRRTAGQDLRS